MNKKSMNTNPLDLRRPWRGFAVIALAAVMTVGLVACSDENDPAAGDDVPNVTVDPLRNAAEGTGVPRPQDGTPAASVVVPSESTPTSGTTGNAETEVTITDDLDLEDMTISTGDSITWTNDGDSAHTITSDDDGDWGTESVDEELEAGDSFTHQFTTPGDYPLSIDDGDATWTVTVE